MESRILVIVVTAIIGGALGFGMSYSVLNTQILTLDTALQAVSDEFGSLSTTVTEIGDSVADHQLDLDEITSNVDAVNTTLYSLPTDWTQYDLDALNQTVLNLQNGVDVTQSNLDAVNTSVTDLNTDLASVNGSVVTAQTDIADVNASFQESLSVWLPTPAYDSGWMDITAYSGESFRVTYGLNTTDVLVDIVGRNAVDGGTHQHDLGMSYVSGWTNRHNLDSWLERAWSIVQTDDGGYAAAADVTTQFGAVFWLGRYSAQGGIMWMKTFNRAGSSADRCFAMVHTGDGGFLIARTAA
jgi:hypothetical protein